MSALGGAVVGWASRSRRTRAWLDGYFLHSARAAASPVIDLDRVSRNHYLRVLEQWTSNCKALIRSAYERSYVGTAFTEIYQHQQRTSNQTTLVRTVSALLPYTPAASPLSGLDPFLQQAKENIQIPNQRSKVISPFAPAVMTPSNHLPFLHETPARPENEDTIPSHDAIASAPWIRLTRSFGVPGYVEEALLA